MNKLIEKNELIELVSELKNKGKTVVATSGCFDILHPGHVTYLEEARKLGDILIVMLNSDASVKQLKGNERPIVGERDRALVLSGLESVNYVYIFSDKTPCDIYSLVMPNVIAKGGDYRGVHIPELDVAEQYGGKVEFLTLVEGKSSTDIINKIKKIGGQ